MALFLSIMLAAAVAAFSHESVSEDDSLQRSSGVDSPKVIYKLETSTIRQRRFSSYKSSVSTFKASEFQDRYIDLPTFLETTSGIEIRRTGGYGQYAEASIRGGSGRDVRVYLDGVLLNSASGGAVDLGKIPLERIQEITVYRNAAPLELMGSGMGGVIELTSDPRGDIVSGNVTTGSFGLFKSSAIYRKKIGSLTSRFNIETARSRNDYFFTHDNGTTLPTLRNPDPTWDDTVMRKSNNHFSLTSLSHSFTARIDEKRSLTQQFSLSHNEEGLFVYYYKDNQSGKIEELTLSLSEIFETELNDFFQSKFKFNARHKNSRFYDPDGHFWVGGAQRDLRSKNPSMALCLSLHFIPTSHFHLSGVLDGAVESYSRRNIYHTQLVEMQRREISSGLELGLNTALTGARARVLYKAQEDISSEQLTTESVSVFPSFETEVRFQMLQSLSFFSSAVVSSRSPTFFERFGWGNSYLSNPQLKNESRREIDGGAEYESGILTTTATFFRGRIYDKIKSIPQSKSHVKLMNFSDTDYRGLEIDLSLMRRSPVSAATSLSLIDSEILQASDTSWTGKKEPFISHLRIHTEVRSNLEVFNLGHEFLYESPFYISADNLIRNSNFPVLSGWFSLNLRHGLTLHYKLENYLNFTNYDFLENPKPGRSHYLSINYSLF